jgi:hypothetical protein
VDLNLNGAIRRVRGGFVEDREERIQAALEHRHR